MKKFFFSLILSLGILISQISPALAQASGRASTSDEVPTGFLTFMAAFYGVFFLIWCILIVVMIITAFVVPFALVDIAKRDNSEIDKTMWVLLIILPLVIPFLNYYISFIGMIAAIYYLFGVKPKLSNN